MGCPRGGGDLGECDKEGRGEVASDQTRKGAIGPLGRASGAGRCRYYRGKEKAPQGLTYGARWGFLFQLPARAERRRSMVNRKQRAR